MRVQEAESMIHWRKEAGDSQGVERAQKELNFWKTLEVGDYYEHEIFLCLGGIDAASDADDKEFIKKAQASHDYWVAKAVTRSAWERLNQEDTTEAWVCCAVCLRILTKLHEEAWPGKAFSIIEELKNY